METNNFVRLQAAFKKDTGKDYKDDLQAYLLYLNYKVGEANANQFSNAYQQVMAELDQIKGKISSIQEVVRDYKKSNF